MERKALIVMTRAFDLWFRAVPELQRYDHLIKVKNRRLGAYLTPGNLGGPSNSRRSSRLFADNMIRNATLPGRCVLPWKWLAIAYSMHTHD